MTQKYKYKRLKLFSDVKALESTSNVKSDKRTKQEI